MIQKNILGNSLWKIFVFIFDIWKVKGLSFLG